MTSSIQAWHTFSLLRSRLQGPLNNNDWMTIINGWRLSNRKNCLKNSGSWCYNRYTRWSPDHQKRTVCQHQLIMSSSLLPSSSRSKSHRRHQSSETHVFTTLYQINEPWLSSHPKLGQTAGGGWLDSNSTRGESNPLLHILYLMNQQRNQ